MIGLLNKYKFILIGLVAAIIAIMFISTWFFSNNPIGSTIPQIPTPIPGSPQSFQKVTIGKTTSQELLGIPGIKKTSDNTYQYPSYLTARSNEIETDNNIASFERSLVPVSSEDPNYTTISKLTDIYGEPEKTIKGSKFYGDFPSTYIYGSKGLAFIGNPNTDEVYELQFFKPMSADEYIATYGSDVVLDKKPVVESH